MSLLRFVAVCYPMKKVYLLTKRRCYISASVIAGVLLVPYATVYAVMRESVPTSDAFNDKDVQKIHHCRTQEQYNTFFIYAWSWISVSLYLLIPFVLIMGLTIAIVHSLVSARKHRRSLMRKGSNCPQTGFEKSLLKKTESTERMITVMLLIASVVFLVLVLPVSVYEIAFDFTGMQMQARGVKKARWEVVKQVVYFLADATHMVNFFLYFLTAKRFRSFAMQLFCKRCLSSSMEEEIDEKTPSCESRKTTSSMLSHHHVDTTKV